MTHKFERKSLDYNTLSDEVLMMKYQDGNEKAFVALYNRHAAKVYGYLRNKIKDDIYSEDVFQAVFMKLHKNRSQYDSAKPFLPWLFTMCKNAMVDHCRKKQRVKEVFNREELSQAVAPDVIKSAPLPRMTELPSMQLRAIELRYHDELSFDEIAIRMDTSPANIRQLISRAFKRLRNASDQEGVS